MSRFNICIFSKWTYFSLNLRPAHPAAHWTAPQQPHFPCSRIKSSSSVRSPALLQRSLPQETTSQPAYPPSHPPSPETWASLLVDSPSSSHLCDQPALSFPKCFLKLHFSLQPVATFQLGLSFFLTIMVITSLSTGIFASSLASCSPHPIYSLPCSQRNPFKHS